LRTGVLGEAPGTARHASSALPVADDMAAVCLLSPPAP
jgi:hypothetical protein